MRYNLLLISLSYIITLAMPSYAGCPVAGMDLIECLEYQIKYHKLPNHTEFQPLSFCELVKLYEEKRINDEQARNLINLGLREAANPILFYDAKREIPFDSYSLNLLWIHAQKQKEEGHFFGQNEEKLERNLIFPIVDWQTKQPEALINFWYDGEMVDDSMIKQTNESLENHKIDIRNVRLRNIREIKLVKENPRLFDSEIPIYFRVDLAKAIIADDVMRSDLLPYAIVMDNDVVAITRRQLFDDKTLDELDNLGYAFGTTPDGHEENSFIILLSSPDLKTL
jgi:hypothetical protein